MYYIKVIMFALLIGLSSVVVAETPADSVYVSIPPLEYFVDVISQHTVDAISLVSPGDNADAYNPTPKQMYTLSHAKAFIGVGLPYEKRLLTRLLSYPSLYVAVVGENISRISYDELEDDYEEDHDEDSHGHGTGDPHIWMSVKNAYVLVKDIYDVLSEIYPQHVQVFDEGRKMLVQNLDELHITLTKMLAPVSGSTFLIYHPVLGYFARDYGLHQLSIQWKGQERSIRQIREIILRAKEQDAKVVFIQKGFPDSAAHTIAEQIDVPVMTIDPLMKDWHQNITDIASLFSRVMTE